MTDDIRVVVERVDDVIRIAPSDAGENTTTPPELADVFLSSLPVLGGRLALDVRSRSAVPTAIIDDEDAAAWWVGLAYGDAVVEAVAESDPAGGPVAVVMTGQSLLLERAGRVLYGVWLSRWLPADAPGLAFTPETELRLDAELGTLLWRTEELYGSEAPAGSLLTPRIVALISRLLDLDADLEVSSRAQLEGRPLGSLYLEAALAAVHTGDLEHEDYDWLVRVYDEVNERLSVEQPSEELAPLTSVDEWTAHREARDLALAAGSQHEDSVDDSEAERIVRLFPASANLRVPLDWRLVHPRSVAVGATDATAAVHFTGSQAVVRIEVPAADATRPEEDGGMIAIVTVGDLESVIAPLTWSGSGYRADAVIDAVDDPEGIGVSIVSSRGWSRVITRGDDGADATRAAVIAFARERASSLAGDPVTPAFAFELD